MFEKSHAIRLICPFTPWINQHERRSTCVADHCMMWRWDGRSKPDGDNMKRKGNCGLAK